MRIAPIVALAALVAAAGASPAAAHQVYGGQLARPGVDDAIVVERNARTGKVESLTIAYRTRCTDGRTYTYHHRVRVAGGGHGTRGPNVLEPIRNTGGRFAARLHGTGSNAQLLFREHGTVVARLSPARATGTVQVNATVVDRSTGRTVATCRSPVMRWRATRAPGRVYAGTTSQYEPVVVFLTRDRRRISKLFVGWHGTCRPSGYVDYPEDLLSFALRRDGVFSERFTIEDLRGTRGEYIVNGRVTRSRVTGRLEVTVLSPEGECGADLRFTARSG